MCERVCVVTGANRGIGLAAVELLCRRAPGPVYLTARDPRRGQDAVQQLQRLGLSPRYHQLDVTDRASVERFRDHLRREHGGLDVLVNNAAVADAVHLYNSYEENKYTIDVNYRSLHTIQELLFPLLRAGARVVNMSSDCGHLSNIRNPHWVERLSRADLTVADVDEFVEWFLESSRAGTFRREDFADEGTLAAYRVSKVALTALSGLQQRALAAAGRRAAVCALHPGLVRTDMTRGAGFLSAAQAARSVVAAALDRELRGAYVWHDGSLRDWTDTTVDCYFRTANLRPSSD